MLLIVPVSWPLAFTFQIRVMCITISRNLLYIRVKRE